MIISYNWLQKYFEEKLPEPKDLAKLLNSHSFEVEAVDPKGDDTIFDIDVLPNRAHDCLCHNGMAKEVSVITGLKAKEIKEEDLDAPEGSIKVTIEDPKKCRRYIAVEMEGVKIGPSPDWLKQSLESIGQKSINNIVDATNYVMFNTGQPLHAFDADKLDGNEIIIRDAKEGEGITTLDNKQVEFTSENLVIADSKDPLAIAGVKGGKKAEVDANTTNLVLESANFAPITVRKTARGFAILTDSSKRFENEISTELAGVAMRELVEIILEIDRSENPSLPIPKVVGKTDIYPRKPNPYKVGFTTAEANRLLGLKLSEEQVEEILNKFNFDFEKIKPFPKVLEMAESLVGVPYESGSSVVYDAPNKFDCSSFTAYLFAQVGIAIPRISVDQYVYGKKIEKENLQAGDLVFSNTGEGKIYFESVEFLPGIKVEEGIDHVGVYLGDGNIIHSSRYNEKGIEVGKIEDFKSFQNIIGYKRMAEESEERFVVTAPYQRMDMRIKEDVIEEIGRVYGLEKIKELPLPSNTSGQEKELREPMVHSGFYYANKVRQVLSDLGFQEAYNYTFRDKGQVKIEKPLASDKAYLRTNLTDGMKEKLEMNLKNAPLLGVSDVKIFEIGKVFPSLDEEYTSLCIGVKGNKKKSVSASFSEALDRLCEELATKQSSSSNLSSLRGACDEAIQKNDNILELNFDELIEKLPQPADYGDVLKNPSDVDIRYKHMSPYPFMLRDIAVWVSTSPTEGLGTNVKEEDPNSLDANGQSVLNLIRENAGDLLVKTKLFDTYSPEGENRTSYAFNLVFQSKEKTLTDDEINKIMENISEQMVKNGWEVR